MKYNSSYFKDPKNVFDLLKIFLASGYATARLADPWTGYDLDVPNDEHRFEMGSRLTESRYPILG